MEVRRLLLAIAAMTRTSLTTAHLPRLGAIAMCLLAGTGCVAEETTTAESAALTGVTPALEYLASLPAEAGGETALARLFAQGTADHVPVGDGVGYPVLFNTVPELNWLASQLWGGKTFRITKEGAHPNGDPFVALDNKIIKTPAGALIDLFDAEVTRSPVGALALGVNDRGEVVAPPGGLLPTVHLSFLDEVREVDPERCPNVYLGRAHVRQCTSLACGELPSLLVDTPTALTFRTQYEWKFWTYFLLDFGRPDGEVCDLAPVIAQVESELAIDLPAAPAAQ